VKTAFVGRDRECADLDAVYRTVADGAFRCVIVTADPGVGKTRLAQEFLERHRDEAFGLTARAHPLSDTASFGMWAEALERHLRDLKPDEIAELCDGQLDDLTSLLHSVAVAGGSAGPQPNAPHSRPRLLGSVRGLLANLSAKRPLIVVLDDIHQADASSWDVLHYLAGNASGLRVLVVALTRTGALTRQQVPMRVLLDLEQEGVLCRVGLTPLPESAIAELARDFIGHDLDEPLHDLLMERSRGNAFFALGLLQALRADTSGTALAADGVPTAVADSIRARTAALNPAARAMLELLAVAGGRVELGELSRIGGWDLEELAAVLSDLVEARLVVEELTGSRWAYEVSHPLISETVHQDTSGVRRLVIHRDVARSLLRQGRLGEAARHFATCAAAGDREAIEVVIDAIGQADERGAYREGITLLGVLSDLIPSGDMLWSSVADALRHWMFDHRADNDTGAGVAALQRIAALPSSSLDDPRRAEVKSRITTLLAYGVGELERATEAAKEAIALFEHVNDERGILRASLELAYIDALGGDVPGWTGQVEQIIERARKLGDEQVLEQAYGALGSARFLAARFNDAEVAFTEASALAKGEPYRVARHWLNLGWSLGYQGRLDDAMAAFVHAKSIDPAWRDSTVLTLEAAVRFLAGDLKDTLALSEECAVLGLNLRRGTVLCSAALVHVEWNEPDKAKIALTRARELYGSRDWFLALDRIRHAEGVLAWREGNLDTAQRLLAAAAKNLIADGAFTFAAPVLLDLAEASATGGSPEVATHAAEQLRTVADRSDGPLITAMADLAAAWAGIASGVPHRGLEPALAATESLRDLGYQLLLGRSLCAVGQARQLPDPAGAVEALTEAAAVFRAIGAQWRCASVLRDLRNTGTAGWRAAARVLGADSLTEREWEVARLAVQRLTAREIAELLVVSRRTVESHLASIYSRLGVHSRNGLIRALAELPR
jgi:DNA-binding CsgD family transcriptional regulator